MRLAIDQWEVDADVEATRAIYQLTRRGSPGDCDCLTCRNFLALGDSAFPAVFRELTEKLGIDHHKAAEIHEWCDFNDSQLDYGGWFHFLGSIQAGATLATSSSSVEQWPWYKLTGDFKIIIDTRKDLAFPEFDGHPLVRLEFHAREPWVLPEPYPQ